MWLRQPSCPGRLRGSFLRKAVGVADQGVTSISNLLLSVAIARQSTPSEFGMFGIAFALYLGCLTIVRGTVGTVAVLRLSQVEHANAVALQRDGFAASVGIGVGLGALLAGIGLAVGGNG